MPNVTKPKSVPLTAGMSRNTNGTTDIKNELTCGLRGYEREWKRIQVEEVMRKNDVIVVQVEGNSERKNGFWW